METTVLEKKNYVENNSFSVYVKIKAVIDTSKIKTLLGDKDLIEQNINLQKNNQDLLVQIETLKKSLENAQNDQAKIRVQSEIRINEQNIRANDWLEKGNKFYFAKRYDEALSAYSKAIEYNQNMAFAYNNRGNVYNAKGNYDAAILDFGQAISLSPDYAHAYNNRGVSYYNKRLYDQAISDFTRAIAINSSYANAYYDRALAYKVKKYYAQALSDLNKYIGLTGGDSDIYNARGFMYNQVGSYDLASKQGRQSQSQ